MIINRLCLLNIIFGNERESLRRNADVLHHGVVMGKIGMMG